MADVVRIPVTLGVDLSRRSSMVNAALRFERANPEIRALICKHARIDKAHAIEACRVEIELVVRAGHDHQLRVE